MYHSILKPLMFRIDPEKAHYKTVSLFRTALAVPLGKSIIKSMYNYQSPNLERKLFGLTFKNPVGLAAGFDKDGKFYKEMSHLGFGFIEIGTVTPLPQDGNPKPRLFRLKEDEGLINRMGFNNDGVDAMVERIKKYKPEGVILGGNIGKNKITPNSEAINDYVICFEKLFDHVDYFVVNVSSPNTPGLRDLQDKGPLTAILSRLMELNTAKAQRRSTEVIKYLHTKSNGAFPIIGVGGIDSAEAAKEKLDAGASLIQVYSGFVYQGPGLVKAINKELAKG